MLVKVIIHGDDTVHEIYSHDFATYPSYQDRIVLLTPEGVRTVQVTHREFRAEAKHGSKDGPQGYAYLEIYVHAYPVNS